MTSTTPGAAELLRHVKSRIRSWRWMIGIASLLFIGLALALLRFNQDLPIWSGKTIIKIGLVAPDNYLLNNAGAVLTPIETPRSLVARISDPTFEVTVIGRAKFDPATAALSKKLAAASLRAVALEGERYVALDVSAGSNADLEAIVRSAADEIVNAHEAIRLPRIEMLRANLSDTQNRADLIEKTMALLGTRLTSMPTERRDQTEPPVVVLSVAGIVETWNKLRDRAQLTTNLLGLTEKTIVNIEPATYVQEERLISPVRAAILVGMALLAIMVSLVIVLSPAPPQSGRGPAEP